MKFKKKLVLKALTDPQFRKLLQEDPEAALNTEELKGIKAGQADIKEVLGLVDQISQNAQRISDMIFCIPPDPDVAIC